MRFECLVVAGGRAATAMARDSDRRTNFSFTVYYSAMNIYLPTGILIGIMMSRNFIGALHADPTINTFRVLELAPGSERRRAVDIVEDVPYSLNVNINYYFLLYSCAYLFTIVTCMCVTHA